MRLFPPGIGEVFPENQECQAASLVMNLKNTDWQNCWWLREGSDHLHLGSNVWEGPGSLDWGQASWIFLASGAVAILHVPSCVFQWEDGRG